jgi:peptide/nickel transport system permease protein
MSNAVIDSGDPLLLEDADPALRVRGGFTWQRFRANGFAMGGLALFALILLMAIAAPFITPGITDQTHLLANDPLFHVQGPSLDRFPALLFGATTDEAPFRGQSILAQITYGARATLVIALGAAIITTVFGLGLGALAGYLGGWVDDVVMRLTDLLLALPFLPLAITLIAASRQQPTVMSLILLFGLVGWADQARFVRAIYLHLREQPFVEAARAAGVGEARILTRHLFPHVIGPLIATTTTAIASFILAETVITYLNVGGYISQVTWGSMIGYGQLYMVEGNWWWVTFPGIFISLTIIALNLIGEGVRDAFDARRQFAQKG